MQTNRCIFQKILLYSVFIFYIVLLCAILFRTSFSFRSVNLVPFHSILGYLAGDNAVLHALAFINVIGNIVIFIPLGLYFTLFCQDKRIRTNLFRVFLISLSVELLQYICMVGIGDIDDIILNCLGGFLGTALYHILLLTCKDQTKVKSIITFAAPICAILSFLFLFLYNR